MSFCKASCLVFVLGFRLVILEQQGFLGNHRNKHDPTLWNAQNNLRPSRVDNDDHTGNYTRGRKSKMQTNSFHIQENGICSNNLSPRILITHTKWPLSQHPKLFLSLPSDAQSFAIYSNLDCNENNQNIGASLTFLNVNERSKEFEIIQRDDSGEVRLLNYNICPTSYLSWSNATTNGNDVKSLPCDRTKFTVSLQWMFDQRPTTTADLADSSSKACVNIGFQQDYKYNRLQLQILKNISNNHSGSACIELFENDNCQGPTTRFFVPDSSPLWEQATGSVTVWQYSRNVDDYFIDKSQHVGSLRICPECIITSSSLARAEAALDQRCNFTERCMPVRNVQHKNRNLSATPSCFYFYNGTNCDGIPLTKHNVSENEIASLATTYPKFVKWGYVSCSIVDHAGMPDKGCPQPLYVTKSLEHVIKFWKPDGAESDSTSALRIAAIAVSILTIFLALLITVLGYLLWRKKRKLKALRQRCVPSKRFTGNPQGTLNQSDVKEANNYTNDISGLAVICSSFAEKFEIPRECIDIGNMRDSTAPVIGVGEFSVAFKGRLEPQGRTVAVKTLKSGQATTRLVKEALKECQMFMFLGKHPRILEFIGVCTQSARRGEIFVVMAWCEYGSLRGFLAQQKRYFVNLVQDGEWLQDDNLEKALAAKTSVEPGPPVSFNSLQLMKWCYEIADAMEFLAVRKIILVTLAARNVLLDEKFATKISDFHMAKVPGDLVPPGSFTTLSRTKERAIPWRWYAIEALVDELFSTASDVWSFGVFMWEVFSLGAVPYPEYCYSSEFTLCIKHGYRLQAPNSSPLEIYQLMLICWFDAPEKRPCFTKIKERISELTPRKNAPISSGRFQVVRSLSKSSTNV